MAILGINHSRLSTKGCSFNVSFSGKLGKIQSDYQSQMGKPVTVYIEVEGFPTESYYGGLKDAIRNSRFFHKHSYLDEVRKIYGDRPTYNRYHNPDNGYNSVYFLNPDEGISNQEREKYDFVVYDNLPVEPFLPHLKSIYNREMNNDYDYFGDLKERADYFDRLETAEEQNLKNLKVQYILKGFEERSAITSKMQEVRDKIKKARQEKFNAMHAYSIYCKAKMLIDAKAHEEIAGLTDKLKENEEQFNKYYKELEEFYSKVYKKDDNYYYD